MKPFDMQARNDAYREILEWGLLAIRDWAAHHGNAELAELEADHIHNLPSLIDEPHEARHLYYLDQERQYYLERLDRFANQEYRDFVLGRYMQPWEVLRAIANQEAEILISEQHATDVAGLLADVCRQLLYMSDVWLLATLGDWSFEEGERNRFFQQYLDSWFDPDRPLPKELLSTARLGINGILQELLSRRTDVKWAVRHPSHGHDIVFHSYGRTDSVEVKYVFDCTYRKQYRHAIPADRNKQPNYQVVFFSALPNYDYPAGCWYGGDRYDRRATVIVGVTAQYQELCQFLGPASWPNDPPHVVGLPEGSDVVTEDRIQSRFNRVFKPDAPWEFSITTHLKGAHVGFAVWDWSQGRISATGGSE